MPKKLGKAHTTEESYRIRVSLKKCSPRSFRYKILSKKKKIKALLCCPVGKFKKRKCRDGMFIRTVLYDKKKWSKEKAETHAKKRFL